jgi:hypothetical protein
MGGDVKKNLTRYGLFAVILISLLIFGSYPETLAQRIGFGSRSERGYIPSPRLIEPVGETLSLFGKKNVTFKWSPHERRSMGRYYVFRLYKGYDMVGTALLKKEKIDVHTMEIDAALFQEGEVYTWSVRQEDGGFGKSDRSFYSFRAVE